MKDTGGETLKNSWTVLVYANGNNELEPEIYSVFKKVKLLNLGENIKIVVQLARVSKNIVEVLRPSENIVSYDNWSGARRYIINSNGAKLISNMGNVNMADPKTLVDFLTWGITNYNSDNIMVILSGHGAGFIGAMTDLSYKTPYMMSFDGIVNSIYQSYQITRKSIDCLVLDSCYMYTMELWYEFSLIPYKPLKYIMVPQDDVLLEGIPYNLLIGFLEDKIKDSKNLRDNLKNITKDFNNKSETKNKLLLIELNKDYFIKLKSEVSKLAEFIIENNINVINEIEVFYNSKYQNSFISFIDLYSIFNIKSKKSYQYIQSIANLLEGIIVYPAFLNIPKGVNKGPSLYLPSNPKNYLEFKNQYNSLLFSYKNKWVNLLSESKNEDINIYIESKNYDIVYPPDIFKIKYLLSSILDENPRLTLKAGLDILKKLGWY
ncbi:hypothetical protein JCM1393_07530 [Clostridium carnis]